MQVLFKDDVVSGQCGSSLKHLLQSAVRASKRNIKLNGGMFTEWAWPPAGCSYLLCYFISLFAFRR